MKKLLPQLGLLFLLLLPLLGRGQEVQISGRVVDAGTKDPVPFASLSFSKSKAGALTDELGNFQIAAKQLFSEDSLIVKTLGYVRSSLLVKTRSAEILTVELRRDLSQSKPVEISKFPYGYYGSQDAFLIQSLLRFTNKMSNTGQIHACLRTAGFAFEVAT